MQKNGVVSTDMATENIMFICVTFMQNNGVVSTDMANET